MLGRAAEAKRALLKAASGCELLPAGKHEAPAALQQLSLGLVSAEVAIPCSAGSAQGRKASKAKLRFCAKAWAGTPASMAGKLWAWA